MNCSILWNLLFFHVILHFLCLLTSLLIEIVFIKFGRVWIVFIPKFMKKGCKCWSRFLFFDFLCTHWSQIHKLCCRFLSLLVALTKLFQMIQVVCTLFLLGSSNCFVLFIFWSRIEVEDRIILNCEWSIRVLRNRIQCTNRFARFNYQIILQ